MGFLIALNLSLENATKLIMIKDSKLRIIVFFFMPVHKKHGPASNANADAKR